MKQLKVSDTVHAKLKKVTVEKGCSFGEAILHLEQVIYRDFPHGNFRNLLKCDECRTKVIGYLREGNWLPTKVIEVNKQLGKHFRHLAE